MKNLLKLITITIIMLSGLSSKVMAESGYTPDFVNGAQVWSDVCSRCHNLREPADLSKRAWKYSMNHMRIRAGLTGQETADILAFILESKTVDDTK